MLRSFVFAATLLAAGTANAALTAVSSFGTNPGALAMYEYVPAGLPSGRPIVVVLHGCTQAAADAATLGWNTLADTYKFAVVYPQQQSANNPVSCFNWAGEYGDTSNLERGKGENESVMEMIDKSIALHGGDTTHVYVVGFSAGAAMASVMAATWPDRIAGVSIMSGIPYRCATSVSGAYSCQSPGVSKTAAQWGDLVRGSHAGPYPRVQVWQGTSDTTVAPMNEGELAKQWTNVWGTDATADESETIGGTTRTAYKAGNTVVVETYSVSGMPHAVAIGTDPAGACPATTGSYNSNQSICAPLRAVQFFGLTGAGPGPTPTGSDSTAPTVVITSPSDGDTVTGALTVIAVATDDVAIDHVTLSADGADVGTSTTAPYQFNWTAGAPGEHVLEAVAVDTSGNEATTSVTVTVPGAGGGSGGGSATGSDGDMGAGALPGCSLDAGGGKSGVGMLALGLGLMLRRRRRR
ncbi:MAG TPA: PHB depolymerase family esterase [Kofleriaceae bacterium]|jgi:poly(hydroxyalkanoate) depolymerase family esterase